VETRRSRKLRSGDVVRLAGRGIYRVKGADQESR